MRSTNYYTLIFSSQQSVVRDSSYNICIICYRYLYGIRHPATRLYAYTQQRALTYYTGRSGVPIKRVIIMKEEVKRVSSTFSLLKS